MERWRLCFCGTSALGWGVDTDITEANSKIESNGGHSESDMVDLRIVHMPLQTEMKNY